MPELGVGWSHEPWNTMDENRDGLVSNKKNAVFINVIIFFQKIGRLESRSISTG